MKVVLGFVLVHFMKRRRTQSHTLPLIMPSDLLLPGSAAGGSMPRGEGSDLESERLILHSVCEVGSTYTHFTGRKRARGAPGQRFSIHCMHSGQ